jgi:hypothetical protein
MVPNARESQTQSPFVFLNTPMLPADYTFFGAVLGTLIYGVFKRYFDQALQPEIQESSNP